MPEEDHDHFEFILKTAEAYFGSRCKPLKFDEYQSNDACVLKFLTDSNTFLLGCQKVEGNQLKFFNDVSKLKQEYLNNVCRLKSREMPHKR